MTKLALGVIAAQGLPSSRMGPFCGCAVGLFPWTRDLPVTRSVSRVRRKRCRVDIRAAFKPAAPVFGRQRAVEAIESATALLEFPGSPKEIKVFFCQSPTHGGI
jgi:hypothetical protein